MEKWLKRIVFVFINPLINPGVNKKKVKVLNRFEFIIPKYH
jgi:hypothetical protein